MRINEDGNVGIGITNPVYKLSIKGSASNPLAYIENTSNSGRCLSIQSATINSDVSIFDITNGSSTIFRVSGFGNTFIGPNAPATAVYTLEVNGDFGYRQSGFTAANGNNNDINIGKYSFIRISGPTGSFAITGISGGQNGKVVTLYNSTSQNMTIVNHSISSTTTSRIITLTGGDIATIGEGTVTLQYSSSETRWIVIAVRD